MPWPGNMIFNSVPAISALDQKLSRGASLMQFETLLSQLSVSQGSPSIATPPQGSLQHQQGAKTVGLLPPRDGALVQAGERQC